MENEDGAITQNIDEKKKSRRYYRTSLFATIRIESNRLTLISSTATSALRFEGLVTGTTSTGAAGTAGANLAAGAGAGGLGRTGRLGRAARAGTVGAATRVAALAVIAARAFTEEEKRDSIRIRT